jgi:hypothetical protein
MIWTTISKISGSPGTFYWIPKLHKCPYQPCSISKCSPRNMQTISLHSINDKKCVISHSRCGVNQLLILTKCNDIQPRPKHAKILTHFPTQRLKILRIAIQNLIFLWFRVVSFVNVVGIYLWLQNDLSKPTLQVWCQSAVDSDKM